MVARDGVAPPEVFWTDGFTARFSPLEIYLALKRTTVGLEPTRHTTPWSAEPDQHLLYMTELPLRVCLFRHVVQKLLAFIAQHIDGLYYILGSSSVS